MSFLGHVLFRAGLAKTPQRRSSAWPALRKTHLDANPACAACANTVTRQLDVHHIEPVHVNPARELDPTNLLTLCTAGPAGANCHLLVGHAGSWRKWVVDSPSQASRMKTMLAAARTSIAAGE